MLQKRATEQHYYEHNRSTKNDATENNNNLALISLSFNWRRTTVSLKIASKFHEVVGKYWHSVFPWFHCFYLHFLLNLLYIVIKM